jgi:hypothetical protein
VNSITVEMRNNYGVDYIYPVCSNAISFTEIADTKTLTPYVIKLIKSLGYKVIVKSNTPEEL